MCSDICDVTMHNKWYCSCISVEIIKYDLTSRYHLMAMWLQLTIFDPVDDATLASYLFSCKVIAYTYK